MQCELKSNRDHILGIRTGCPDRYFSLRLIFHALFVLRIKNGRRLPIVVAVRAVDKFC